MANVYDKLNEKGITLPAPPPKGGVYTPVQEFGTNLLYCSGCGPDLGNGNTVVGKLGKDPTNRLGFLSGRRISASSIPGNQPNQGIYPRRNTPNSKTFKLLKK